MEIKVFTITKEKELATFKLSGNFRPKTKKMEIVINNNGERIPATLEVVDVVMIVSPKEEKVDISQFKDGDIITCVLRGKTERIIDNYAIDEHCSLNCDTTYSCKNGDSDSATWVRYATEEEKQKLFDALAKEGKVWDSEKKAVVDLKWYPKECESFWLPFHYPVSVEFRPVNQHYYNNRDNVYLHKGWCFKTQEECEAYCERLNQAIMEVKP